MEARKFKRDFASLAAAHLHFARWERVRHRAKTVALISFPHNHPLRLAVDTLCGDLEAVRCEVEGCLLRITKKHGTFRTWMNGHFFESPEADLFKSSAERYHDCPEYVIGPSIARRKILPLAGASSIHVLEPAGKSFLAAASLLVAETKPEAKRRLDQTAKTFDHGVRRVQRQLKRVKVNPQHKIHVLLCLRRLGLANENAHIILDYLV